MDDKKAELLKKLKALADRGEAGERETARRKLEELMDKYGADEADLADEALSDVEFRYRDKYEQKILNQVFYRINHERQIFVYSRSRAKVLLWRCTTAEGVRAKIEYEFFRELWREDVNLFLSAFIQKHGIFRADPDAPTTEIDKEELMRMYAMMRGMQDRQPMLQITEGECDA